jgi:hypothetical protein
VQRDLRNVDLDRANEAGGVTRVMTAIRAPAAPSVGPHPHGQVMPTLATHGTAVALGAHVTELQHQLEVGARRRHPMAERPTALEIAAA